MARLNPFLTASPQFNPVQSAYRSAHSTETALLKVLNDVYESVDARVPTVIAALDISAAFDTICHSKLLNRLRDEFGVEGVVLTWIESYLSGRSHFVRIDQQSSTTSKLDSGVPQGSVLGPLLFAAYVSPVGDVIQKAGLKHHQYADDTQLYLSVRSPII